MHKAVAEPHRRAQSLSLLPTAAEHDYFFGEERRVFGDRLHVVNAAWLGLLVELVLLVLHVVVIPLTVGYFNAITVVEVVVGGAAWLAAAVELVRSRHRLIWPLIVVKCTHALGSFMTIGVLGLLALIARGSLVSLLLSRYRTLNQSNIWWHVAAWSCQLLVECVLGLLSVYVLLQAANYNASRAKALYTMQRAQHLRYFLPA